MTDTAHAQAFWAEHPIDPGWVAHYRESGDKPYRQWVLDALASAEPGDFPSGIHALTITAVEYDWDPAAQVNDQLRAANINLSATLERALEDALRQERRERWLAENAAGIAAYNAQVDEHGAFADTLRSF